MGKRNGRQSNNSRKSKKPSVALVEELRKEREIAYYRFGPADAQALKNYARWLKEPGKSLEHLIQGLEKKLPKIREPLVRGTVGLALINLKKIQRDLEKASKDFEISLSRTRDSFKYKNPKRSSKIDFNKQISLLAEHYGGATKLHKHLLHHPQELPVGMKETPSVEAIRKRMRRYKERA